jgi:predicted  nucleic acid-binding Zn-ribbon protein
MAKVSAMEQLAALKDEFEKKAAKIKDEAIADVKADLAAARAKVYTLEEQLAALTGKAFAPAASGRTRMKQSEKEALQDKLIQIMPKSEKAAKSKADLCKELGVEAVSWQTLSAGVPKLTKVGELKDAKYYQKA